MAEPDQSSKINLERGGDSTKVYDFIVSNMKDRAEMSRAHVSRASVRASAGNEQRSKIKGKLVKVGGAYKPVLSRRPCC